MASRSPVRVKIATEPWEFSQIHELNHRTFTGEIPQHPSNGSGRLVDRFHDENTYVVGLDEGRLVGMLAIRGQRPFSLDGKLPDLDRYLPAGKRVCELRLLVVEKNSRAGTLLPAILEHAWTYIQRRGFDVAVISGVTHQLKLYRHLGFEPFGPLTGTPPVQFQPMMIGRERFAERAALLFRRPTPARASIGGSFLPGPVTVHRDVSRALARPARSHRSAAFHTEVESVKTELCRLTGATRTAVLLGSGTMANDVIAGQIARDRRPGLVLTNGEFGDRLVDHARRWHLEASVIAKPWGDPFDVDELARHFVAHPEQRWIWFVHAETSTGVLNDLDRITAVAAAAGVEVCADAISSIGTAPIDLRGVRFASGVSGKGLGAFAGLALVFHHEPVSPAPEALPAVLDLGLYAGGAGVPFTQSSNLVHALHVALRRVHWPTRLGDVAEMSAWLRAHLDALGLNVIGKTAAPAPGVVTIALASATPSSSISEALERRGYLISANSRYLTDRNWVQISLMGETRREDLEGVSAALREIVARPPS